VHHVSVGSAADEVDFFAAQTQLATWVDWLKLVLGVLLLLVALREWRARPRGRRAGDAEVDGGARRLHAREGRWGGRAPERGQPEEPAPDRRRRCRGKLLGDAITGFSG
jgi:hypothetical protein